MVKNSMILFTRDKMEKILGSLKIKTEKTAGDEEEILFSPMDDKPAVCRSCESVITTINLGHIAHGSMDFYCNNPACFGHFIAKRKLW